MYHEWIDFLLIFGYLMTISLFILPLMFMYYSVYLLVNYMKIILNSLKTPFNFVKNQKN